MTEHHAGANRYWGNRTRPKSKSEFFNAVTSKDPNGDATIATVRLYGPIDSWGGWWGVSAKEIGQVLDALPDTVTQIVLRINSPGGEVFEGVSILNMLRAHRASVTAVVDGWACSAASVIAAGCDETVMSPATQMMIHSPWTFMMGNAAELRKTAERLDGVEASMVEIYAAKAGDKDWTSLLAEETWLTGPQAVDLGLADRIAVVPDAGETETVGDEPIIVTVPDPEESDDDVDDAAAMLIAARVAASKPPSSPEPGSPNQKEALAMSDALKAGLSARLGVTDAGISDEALLAAVDEALAEQADTTTDTTVTTPEGTQLIEDSVLDQLRSDAAAGRQARDEQISARRDGVIAAALSDGRITSASAPTFRQMLDKDEDTASAVIASLAKNTVPVSEIGHAAGEKSAEEALMAAAGWGDETEEAR